MAFHMQLHALELENFHQFKRYSVDFDQALTVLVGDNGAGKSSVLAAASIALNTFVRALTHKDERSISRNDARREQYQAGGVSDLQEQYPVVVRASGLVGESDEPQAWMESLSSTDDQAKIETDCVFRLAQECRARVQDGDSSLVLPVIAHYGTDRLWVKSKASQSARRKAFTRLDGYTGALHAHANQDQMLTWFFKMTAQDVQRAQSLRKQDGSALYAAVRGAVGACFKAITGSDQVNVTYNLDTDDLAVEYMDSDQAVVEMPMGLLSDGYRTTLSMVADIAYRMALLNPALEGRVLETPGVVLIDEVDLHLHPLWQARILGDLKTIFPNVQFIVTTHAPVVISSVRAQHIRMLDGDEKALMPTGEVYGSDVGRILISIMDAPERPEAIQQKFDSFYSLLDSGNLKGAADLLDEIEAEIGSDDTDIVGAHTALSIEEADVRYAAD